MTGPGGVCLAVWLDLKKVTPTHILPHTHTHTLCHTHTHTDTVLHTQTHTKKDIRGWPRLSPPSRAYYRNPDSVLVCCQCYCFLLQVCPLYCLNNFTLTILVHFYSVKIADVMGNHTSDFGDLTNMYGLDSWSNGWGKYAIPGSCGSLQNPADKHKKCILAQAKIRNTKPVFLKTWYSARYQYSVQTVHADTVAISYFKRCNIFVIGFISETHITYDINTFSSTVKESTSFRLRAVDFPTKRDSKWLSNSKSETIVPRSLHRPALDGQSTFRAMSDQSCPTSDSVLVGLDS